MLCMQFVLQLDEPQQILKSHLPWLAQALKEDGSYIINDPRGRPTPAENIHENADLATVYYGFSCHCCLPSGKTQKVWTLSPAVPMTLVPGGLGAALSI